MKRLSAENFFTDFTHPRAFTRDFESDSTQFDPISTVQAPILVFHQFNNSCSRITCYKEPSLNKIKTLKEVYGINSILSCLTEREFYQEVQKISSIYDLNYFHIQIENQVSNHLKLKFFRDKLLKEIKNLYNILMCENKTLLIHSASGVRRTGIIVYSLLRLNGESKESALEILLKLRGEKKNGVGDFRIEFTEKYIIPYLIDKKNSSNFLLDEIEMI